MLTLVRSHTQSKEVRQALNALLVRVSADVWVGQVTLRVQAQLKAMLAGDTTSAAIVGKVSGQFCELAFEEFSAGQSCVISPYEIFSKKRLRKK